MKFKTLIVIFLFCSSQLICQNSDWYSLQPTGIGAFKSIQVKSDGSIYLLTNSGLYKSIDKGNTWIEVFLANIASFSLYNEKNIVLSKNDAQGNCSIVLLREENDTLISEGEYFINKKDNSLRSSVTISKFFINKEGVYAIVEYRSETDYGYLYSNILFNNKQNNTWQAINCPGHYINGLFVKEKDTLIISGNSTDKYGSHWYAAWYTELNYSFDGGNNWFPYYIGLNNTSFLYCPISSIYISDKNAIFYNQYDTGAGICRLNDFRNINYKDRWEIYLGNIGIIKLIPHPTLSYLYALSNNSVYVSTNDGENWYNKNKGQIITGAIDFKVDENGIVYIISSNKLYISKNDITGIEKDNNNIPHEFELFQNYPNPFNPNTIIKFSLPKATYVSLMIYNNVGQEVAQLVSQFMNAGVYTTEWNASHYSSGIYYYRITAGEFVDTKKLLLLK